MDELWSFVGGKENKQWVWLAMDRETREVVGFALRYCLRHYNQSLAL